MYYDPQTHSYSYYDYGNTPMNYQDYMSRNQVDIETVLGAIKREASAIDLYRQLAKIAPNQKHKNDILHALEGKKAHFTQFTNIYSYFTGTQPLYQVDKVVFQNYRDGLQKAYQAEVEGYEEYQKSSLLTQHPQVRNAFLWALTGDQENVTRFEFLNEEFSNQIKDYGADPFVINIDEVTKQNDNFRTALWTGEHLQITLMSIEVGGDIGLENHPNLDQFLRIEQGQGLVEMGDSKDNLVFKEKVYDDYAIVIPAGKWHNLTNTGNEPIKLYSIYAPPQHPFGTVHETKEIAMAAEEEHHD